MFKKKSDEGTNVWAIFTDVMTAIVLILMFFILAQYVVIGKVLQISEIEKVQNEIREQLKEEFKEDFGESVKEQAEPQYQKITFSDKILFDTGKYELMPIGEKVLKIVAGVINKSIENCEEDYLFDEIQIQGHTDDRPFNSSRYPRNNWELSSARATSVVRYFIEECHIIPSKDMLVSAQGYSEFNPIDPKNRSLNRRIEIVLKYSLID